MLSSMIRILKGGFSCASISIPESTSTFHIFKIDYSKPDPLKIVLFGDSNTDRTDLALKFVLRSDIEDSTDIGTSYLSREINDEGKCFTIKIWDTSGQTNYGSYIPLFLKEAHGVF